MGRFIGDMRQLELYPMKDPETGRWGFAVSSDFAWEVGPRGSGWYVTIEEGFFSDLGSVPWWLRWLINPADAQCAPAWVLHDKINRLTQSALPNWLNGFSSQFAVSQLYEALVYNDAPLWKSIVQYFGVSFGIAANEWYIGSK